jgi:hypothetical protein
MTDELNLTGDSLAWYARAIYRCRWFFLTICVLGLTYGVWQAIAQPDFRTVATLRLKNELIDYQHRGYWDPQGRTMLAQARTIATSLAGNTIVSVKPESDSWLVRIEVTHQNAGEGEQLVQQLLVKLKELNQTDTTDPKKVEGTSEPNVANNSRRLVDLLDQIEVRLKRLNAAGPPVDTAAIVSPPQSFRVSADYIVRLPLDQLPLAERFARLQQRIDQYFQSASAQTKEQRNTAVEDELLMLQEQALMEMLKTWGRMDLNAAAASENQIFCDVLYEQPVEQKQQMLREIFLWSCLAIGAAILVIVPWVWCVDNWRIIAAQ